MSVKIMGAVWGADLPPNEHIVLLSLADHADHDGGNVKPSVRLTAWKTNYSERQVRRILRSLEKAGILDVIEERAAQGLPSVYRIRVEKIPQKAPFEAVRRKRALELEEEPEEEGGEDNLTGGDENPKAEAFDRGGRTPGRQGGSVNQVSGITSGNVREPSEDSVSKETGGGAAAKVEPEEWTDGALMGLVREKCYRDRKAPAGWDDGRDVTIIRALAKHRKRVRIAYAIQGLAMMRDSGELAEFVKGQGVRKIGTDEGVTLRLLFTDSGVQPLFERAENRFLATPARGPVGVVTKTSSAMTPLAALLPMPAVAS